MAGDARARRSRPSAAEACGPRSPRLVLPSLAPEVHHVSQREVGARAVAEAVGQRRDPDGVARKSPLPRSISPGPAEERVPVRCARGTARARPTGTRRPLRMRRIQVRFVVSRPRRAGGRRAARPGCSHARRSPWSPKLGRCSLGARFRYARFPASTSTSMNERRPGHQRSPCSLPISSYSERALREQELTVVGCACQTATQRPEHSRCRCLVPAIRGRPEQLRADARRPSRTGTAP